MDYIGCILLLYGYWSERHWVYGIGCFILIVFSLIHGLYAWALVNVVFTAIAIGKEVSKWLSKRDHLHHHPE